MISHFGLSWADVIWDISWPNIVMLMSSIPRFDTDTDEEDEPSSEKKDAPDGEIQNKSELMRLFSGV